MSADFLTLAEDYDVPEEQVELALSHLRIDADEDDFTRWALRYRPEGMRQVRVWRWDEPKRVAEEVAEAREKIDGTPSPLLWGSFHACLSD